MASSKPDNAFTDLQNHCDGNRTATDITFLNILKNRHPNHHITSYTPANCDLHGYAAAGFAKSTLIDDDESFALTTSYHAPALRLERQHHPGDLKDTMLLACWRYEWTTTEFLVYNLQLRSVFRGGPEIYAFVLAPRSDGAVSKGHSTATDKLMLAAGQWSQDLHEEVYVFDGGSWVKNKDLHASIQTSTWDDVILDASTKTALIDDVEGFFDSRDLYAEFAVPWKRGIIFHGLPGNGKTISIKALMAVLARREEPVPSLYVKSFEGCAGQQMNIRNIFARARIMAPCLLIFEDLDSLITDATRSYFLNEVDGLEKNDGILMIGSTNHLDALDPAIRDRPSRFDRKYHYRLPGFGERVEYARYWQKKLERNPRVDFPEGACGVIASLTDGFSFAYLKELFVAVLLVIARGGTGEGKIPDTVSPNSNVLVNETKEGEQESPANEAVELDEKQEAARLRRQAFSSVSIPEELQNSILVKVMRQQIYTLLEEMDNNAAPARDRIPRKPKPTAAIKK
ncbi:proteasome-activating nucleotidase [Pseudovirgaria hyperparasitica]|uniref:Proteasome-activating nucleotidase n=1 Tax=Pseudovirgaria hyperparasitica TaxID=470096 RepID=A0A6A6VXC1_9PEZI|nr:proteasome-activating nucleotidase [Pseudovirgaria hyperparasitica]KAF2755318.1 proteasome-activating nucleotidase [Pseudovirgaria hyperparasitica]